MNKALLLTIILLTATLISNAQPGTLDKSFSKNGQELVSKYNRGETVLCLADGKILVGGARDTLATSYFSLSRYNSNGSADSSFNNGNIKIINTSEHSGTGILSMALTADNKIIAAGSGNDLRSIVLVRYNYDGSTDSSFGVNGISEIDCKRFCFIGKMIILPHGNIVICGTAKSTVSDTAKACLIRIEKNGVIDTKFGDNGFVILNVSPYSSGSFNGLALQPDGKIVAVGAASFASLNNNFLVARFMSNGSLDATFGTNGIVVTPLNNNQSSSAVAVAVLSPSKRIVVAGSSFGSIAVVKYLPNGSFDSSFNSTGSNIISFDDEIVTATGMVIDAAKKIVVSGYTQAGKEVLASLNEKGLPPTNFGTNGKTVTIYVASIYHNAVALQTNGKIVVAGSALNQNNLATLISIARYFGNYVSTAKNNNGNIEKSQKANTIIRAEY